MFNKLAMLSTKDMWDNINNYIHHLTKNELRQVLMNVIEDSPDWLVAQFIQHHLND